MGAIVAGARVIHSHFNIHTSDAALPNFISQHLFPSHVVLQKFSIRIQLLFLTLCLPSINLPCATLFWGTLELGHHFGSTIFNLLYIFTCKSYEKTTPKARLITLGTVRNRNNGNRCIEQYELIIHVGVCITVQICEYGKFTDVQIGEHGKQRVKGQFFLYTRLNRFSTKIYQLAFVSFSQYSYRNS